MDISTKTIEELKALAYDLLVEQERVQRNLKIVNDQIALKLKEVTEKKEEVKEEKKKK